MKVVIMRGVPGSGKSTYIKNNCEGAVIASADNFFMKDGRYNFNIKQIGLAHDYCFRTFTKAMKDKAPLVVVDNTNVKARDMKRYVDGALAEGYTVEIVKVVCDPAKAASRNVHAVPKDIVERMHRELTDSKLPAEWPVETLVDNTKN